MNKTKNETQINLSIREDQPTSWFESLYSKSNKDGEGVPWANMGAHPSFLSWLDDCPQKGNGKRALVVGCGMGDDAIALESLGFDVVAFDVSRSAIEYCEERFPQSTVVFVQADLLEEQAQWHRKFDFVLEIYTIQALPPKYESELIRHISSFVAPNGELLVIADVGTEEREFENGPPWLLTASHIMSFESCGLTIQSKEVNKNPLGDDGETYVSTYRNTDK